MKKSVVVLAALFLLSVVVGDAFGQVQYTVAGLGGQIAVGINNSGQVLGSQNPFCSGGSTQYIPGGGTIPHGLNDSGEVVGEVTYGVLGGGFNYYAFLYSGGVMQGIEIPPGNVGSRAFGINNLGQIAGYAWPPDRTGPHAFLDSGGNSQDLGTLGRSGQLGLWHQRQRTGRGTS